ncbi:MAG: hypothetical protein VX899_09785 [Myxococcota bacterium]|nr:hypothetical protein [Myxococcota bacterium]
MPIWLSLLACAAHPDQAPEPCLQMCAEAQSLYGACLEDWGLGWEDAGYSDGQDFQASCEVWTWELLVLEEEEISAGDPSAAHRTESMCSERLADLSADEATCSAYTEQQWGGLL